MDGRDKPGHDEKINSLLGSYLIPRLMRRLAHLAVVAAERLDGGARREARAAPAVLADERGLKLPDRRARRAANLGQVHPGILLARVADDAQEWKAAVDRGAQRGRRLHRPAEQAHALVPCLAGERVGVCLSLLRRFVLEAPFDAALAP